MLYDDSDMKIVGEHREEEDTTVEAEQKLLKKEHENGNLDRARALGRLLAQTLGQGEQPLSEENRVVTVQRWQLLTFAVEVELDRLLPSVLTAQTATNAFYDTLRTEAEAVYEEFRQNGSLTFYYLCLQEGERAEEKIGETFASLCGHAGEAEFAAAGTQLYRSCVLQIAALTAVQGFVED